jgi:hypothetical protein
LMLHLLEQWAGSADEHSRDRMFGGLGRRDSRCHRFCLEDAGLTKFQWQTARESPGLAEPPINRFKLADEGTENPRRSEEGKNAKGGKKDEGEGA